MFVSVYLCVYVRLFMCVFACLRACACVAVYECVCVCVCVCVLTRLCYMFCVESGKIFEAVLPETRCLQWGGPDKMDSLLELGSSLN